MTKQEYYDQIIELIDKASEELSRDEYKNLCEEVQDETYSRYDAMESEDYLDED